MFKTLLSLNINDIIDLFQKAWKYKGCIMLALTSGTGLSFLTFFKSQLGVAITCGIIFVIVCFVAIFLVAILSKSDNSQTIKAGELATHSIDQTIIEGSKPLTKDDLQLLIGGEFKNGRFVPYSGSRHYMTTSMELNKKMGFSYHLSPYNSLSKLRISVEKITSLQSTKEPDVSKLIFYIYDDSGEEKSIHGGGGEIEIYIGDKKEGNFNAAFQVKISYIGDLDNKSNIRFKINLISWKKV